MFEVFMKSEIIISFWNISLTLFYYTHFTKLKQTIS